MEIVIKKQKSADIKNKFNENVGKDKNYSFK